ADQDGYPMRLCTAQGGAQEHIGLRCLGNNGYKNVTSATATSLGVGAFFGVMSNELSTPKILYCPSESDSTRQAASTFAGSIVAGTANAIPYTNDMNVRYFVGVGAQDTYPGI